LDPFGTIGRALWIGGGQWAGKSAVATTASAVAEVVAARFRATSPRPDTQPI